MIQQKSLFICFFLFFCFQTSCMTLTLNHCVNVFDEITHQLDYTSHMHFLMTNHKFYTVFTKYPNPDDYTNDMIYYARNNDVENFNFLLKRESPINKKERQHIEKFFERFSPKIPTINLYGKIYNEKNSYDFNIGIMYHVFNTNKPVFEFLLKQEYKYSFNPQPLSDLQLAVGYNNLAYAKILLNFHQGLVDRNVQEDGEITALRSAFMLGQFKMVKLLLTDPYVDVNTQNGSGDTFLHLVVKKKNSEVLKLLLANPHVNYAIKNNEGRTAYDCAEDPHIKKLLSLFSC